MPQVINEYLPLPDSPFKMQLIIENGNFYLRFLQFNNRWFGADTWDARPFKIMSPRRQVAFIGSMAHTHTVETNRLVWETSVSANLHPQKILLTSNNRGFFIRGISQNRVSVSNINLNNIDTTLCTVEETSLNPQILIENYRRDWTMQEFLGNIFMLRAALSLEFMRNCAIVVAVGTGFTMAIGFGPAAGIFGLSGSTAGTTLGVAGSTASVLNAFAGAIASGFTAFLQANFEEMTRIAGSHREIQELDRQVRQAGGTERRQLEIRRCQLASEAARQNATRFWENNSGGFQRVVSRSIISGSFSYLTSYIPGGPGISSPSDISMQSISSLILSRLANNITGIIQNIFTDIISDDTPNWQSIRTGFIRDITVRGIG